MSGESERILSIRSLPRWAAQGVGWILLCLTLRDVVPAPWAWLAFPAALVVGIIAAMLRIRDIFALLFIISVPLIVRLVVSIAASPMTFDNGWLLTAPYWYFTATWTWLVIRRPAAGVIEALVLAVWSASILSENGDFGMVMSAPAAATLRLTLGVLVLILAVLSLAAVRRDREIQGQKLPRGHDGRLSAGRVLYGFILLVFLFVLFFLGFQVRRERSLQSGGGVLTSELFRFDFDDVLNLEPEISLNAELTMLYREDGPSTVRYLRRFTLSGWDDRRGFFRDGEKEVDSPQRPPIPTALPKTPESWPDGPTSARVETRQEYYLIALDPDSFFALDYPISVEPWKIWDDASFTRAYAVESLSSVAGPWELMDAGTEKLPEDWSEYYLAGGDDDYYEQLAGEIIGEEVGAWNQASAVERWFHDEFRYSLRPGTAPDGDQLSWFLKETRRGYCSYFAFAMTRICRAAGIPARVAVGFLTDPESSTLGFVPVRSDQAHAWVEIWLDDYGWISFDPTSNVMAPGEDYPFRFISPDEWLPLVEEVLTRSGEISVAIDDTDEENGPKGGWWERTLTAVRHRPIIPMVVIVLLLTMVYLPGRIIPGMSFLLAHFSSSYRRRAIADWRSFTEKLIRAGYRPDGNTTPLDWARQVESLGLQGFVNWTRLYLKAEYSMRFDVEDDGKAQKAATEVGDTFSAIPGSKRLRSALSPGWKGHCPW